MINVSNMEKDNNNKKKDANKKIESLSWIQDKMDDNNKKVFQTMINEKDLKKGMEKAVEQMFIHPETGKPIDYATMRYYYG